jgi:phospholipase/carboxylesterase
LLRAMAPLTQPPKADLTGKPVLIVSGARDAIVSARNVMHLAATLSDQVQTFSTARCPVAIGCLRAT